MRTFLSSFLLAQLACASSAPVAVPTPAPGSQPAAGSPTPAVSTPPPSMADLLAASSAEDWRPLSPEVTLYLELRRNRRDAWYEFPAGRIEPCNVPIPVRSVPTP